MKIDLGKYISVKETRMVYNNDKGPPAICSGTLLPCPAGKKCPHFGVHKCRTFRKHIKSGCPHFPDHEFKCVRVEDENEK